MQAFQPDQSSSPSREPLGLYVHVPFCTAICNYCNFNRGLFDAPVKERYVTSLVREIEGVGVLERRQADTIYFGGGTPSLLEPGEVARIIAACERTFDVADAREVTLEANPESIAVERLAAYRAAGVNRLSIGVQSLRDEELKRLSRLHDSSRARKAVAEARAAGFDNVNLDLMMWLPGQSVGEWLESVDGALALGPEHISLYMLEVYPNSPLKDEMVRARWSQAADDDVAEMYVTAMDRLEAAGYAQYEISNVARPGRRSRHNVKYWTDGEWYGFGCGAHSTTAGERRKNVSSTAEYISRVDRSDPVVAEVRHLADKERLGDALFTGLRLTEGVDLEAFGARYGVDVWQRYGRDLQPHVRAGLLLHDSGGLRLSRHGMLLAHEVMVVFV
jgi:oxygen-independent coproporphyrinogen-3 oxidase